MFKLCVFFAIVLAATASPAPGYVASPLAYSAPLVAAPVVTAHSSQVISQNFHGVAAPYIAHPAAYVAHPAAAPLLAAPAPYYAPYAHAPAYYV